MRDGGVETYYEDGQWKNRVHGNSRASSVHDTKDEARRVGRDMAMKRESEHFIKNRDGTIGERNSYGDDPHPPKG